MSEQLQPETMRRVRNARGAAGSSHISLAGRAHSSARRLPRPQLKKTAVFFLLKYADKIKSVDFDRSLYSVP